jgi:hypothetical protein
MTLFVALQVVTQPAFRLLSHQRSSKASTAGIMHRVDQCP